MEQGLLDQGITLMLVGMGTVFVFLTVFVAATSLKSMLLNRFLPASRTSGIGDEEIVAISARIDRPAPQQRRFGTA